MGIDHEALEKWKQIYSRWGRALGRARKARFDANIALLNCAYGVGRPPTQRQINRVRRLEHDAEMLRLEMDATIFSMFGTDSGQRGHASISPMRLDFSHP